MASLEQQPTSPKTAHTEELNRAITGWGLYFYVLGDVLGSGIYVLVGVIALAVGGAFWTSFAIGVAAAMLTGLAYAELITKYPRAGGASSFTHRAFNNRILTFFVTFAMVAASLSAGGALALAFSAFFAELLVSVVTIPIVLTGVIFMILLAYVNFRGISESVKVNIAMTLTEVTGLVIVLAIGIFVIFGDDADFGRPFEFNSDGNPVALALSGSVLAFFAMSGFENSANVAEEVQNPSKVFPRSLLGGMATAGIIYLVIAFIASIVTPTEVLGDSEVALLEVVRTGLPEFPEWLFALIACIAIANTTLVQSITMSRIMYGMGREHIVPRIFSRTHHSRRTPWPVARGRSRRSCWEAWPTGCCTTHLVGLPIHVPHPGQARCPDADVPSLSRLPAERPRARRPAARQAAGRDAAGDGCARGRVLGQPGRAGAGP